MMKNKMQTLLFAAIALLALGVQPVFASVYTNGYVIYDIGVSSATIIDCDTAAAGDLIIPATVQGMSITTVGTRAFQSCTSLTNISLPSSVITLEPSAFAHCISLTNMVIPSGVTTIGSEAFDTCRSLTDITIPSGVMNIEEYTFYNCISLTNISIPSGVTNISEGAFYACELLSNLTLPENLVSIGLQAFGECYELTNVMLPASLTSLGEEPFPECYKLLSIEVDPLNAAYASIDGVVFSKDLTSLILFPDGKPGPYAIPNGTLDIGDYAFVYSTSLTNIIFPNSVTNIGKRAFAYSALTSIVISDSVKNIEILAFYWCGSLTNATIGSGVTNISDDAFKTCNQLLSIVVDPLNTTYASVDGVLFSKDLTALLKVPAARLGSYSIPDGTLNIEQKAFYSSSITNVAIPNSVTNIGAWAFCFSKLTNIVIPPSVTTLDESAFSNCRDLTNINFSEGLLSIGVRAFESCLKITDVVLPASVTNISAYAFSSCIELTHIRLLGNAPTLADVYAFPISDIKVSIGATGYDTGLFATLNIIPELIINSVASEPSGNLVLQTDALTSTGLRVTYSPDLTSAFTDVTGITSGGIGELYIPAANAALQGTQGYFKVVHSDDI